ncbi:MAG TPA: T9SS type A sorting domain-containing protein [bacterium]
MRKIFAISAAVLVLSCQVVIAQQIVNVAPGLNTLADAVNVSSAGDVLVLQRGAGYPNQGTINVSVPITIRAADGAGDRPLLAVAADASGAFAGTVLSLFADVKLENLAFNGIRTAGDRAQRIGQVFQMFADNLRCEIDGCSFVGFGGRTLEPGRDGATLIVRNCIETGNGRSNRVDNGRLVDFRAASADTFILQNNTLLNCADRWIRHMLEDASLDYVLFDHNTFMNGTGYRPSFQFRNVRELYFINNIVINPSILGTTPAGVRKDELEYADPEDVVCTFTLAGADSSNDVLVMKNNNVWRDPRIDAILGDFNLPAGDSVAIAPWFDKAFEDRVDEATAFFSEELTFVKAVTIDSLLPELEIYVGGTKGYSHSAFIFRTDEIANGVDMSYGTTAQSYTAAGGGFPLGDLNWYPDRKTAWIAAGMPTSVEDENPGTPTTFRLSQNYPNPFNPGTAISYSLETDADVRLEIYNLMGQKLRTLVNERKSAGTYTATWDGSSDNGMLQSSGIYFYKMSAGSQIEMKKMALVK